MAPASRPSNRERRGVSQYGVGPTHGHVPFLHPPSPLPFFAQPFVMQSHYSDVGSPLYYVPMPTVPDWRTFSPMPDSELPSKILKQIDYYFRPLERVTFAVKVDNDFNGDQEPDWPFSKTIHNNVVQQIPQETLQSDLRLLVSNYGQDPLMLCNLIQIIITTIISILKDNLVKDTFLRQQMDAQGWVSIKLIAGFKKVKQLTNNIQLILDALQASDVVEVQGDKVRCKNDWIKWILPPVTNSQMDNTHSVF